VWGGGLGAAGWPGGAAGGAARGPGGGPGWRWCGWGGGLGATGWRGADGRAVVIAAGALAAVLSGGAHVRTLGRPWRLDAVGVGAILPPCGLLQHPAAVLTAEIAGMEVNPPPKEVCAAPSSRAVMQGARGTLLVIDPRAACPAGSPGVETAVGPAVCACLRQQARAHHDSLCAGTLSESIGTTSTRVRGASRAAQRTSAGFDPQAMRGQMLTGCLVSLSLPAAVQCCCWPAVGPPVSCWVAAPEWLAQ
jgi:hypothetical protein